MSTDNSLNGTTKGATPRVENVLWGGTVFFKVEDTIFEGAGADDVEGRHGDHPIVLKGYKAADFAAIVKVLYPA
ncbi:hypothetical protein EST38_g9547 [Candolleomyces aberdarensis]|uniref:Uncharacterized protein n=1 Tax=Candolleomyces aberdarensis TaxID=2316362 RepID=A0A4Q2DCJ8_9AGAR|nr:hypothetical protein EST38_g9547 [Candolleomyces aberdarensis]